MVTELPKVYFVPAYGLRLTAYGLRPDFYTQILLSNSGVI